MALLMAVFVAGILTYFLFTRLRRGAGKAQVTQIVAAAKDLPAGVALTANDLNLIDWPAAVPLPGSFSKVEQVAGRPLIYALGAKEPVMARDLAVSGSGIGLAVKIPPGMRATSIRSNEVTGVAGFVYPGSHVDVLGTFNVPGATGPVTQTILQNVEVITAGEQIEPDPQGKPQTVNVVTLLLSPEDSQKLLLASGQGTIQFVLRNGADQAAVHETPTSLSELVSGAAKPVATPVARAARPPKQKAVPAPKPPDVYILEVIQGSARSDQKFSGSTPVGGPGGAQQ